MGKYDNNGNEIIISVKNDKLFRGENEFYRIAREKYYIPASGTVMKFRRNELGEVDAIIVFRGEGENLLHKITNN